MGEFVVEVSHSGNLVVLRTPPGSAHVIGSALDRSGLRDVLGTVAGDDTLLIICAEGAEGTKVADHLATLAGL
jgi:transcriptional regulator of arginine metabolism